MASTICTLSGFPDLFEGFAESVERFHMQEPKVIVTSRGFEVERPGWRAIAGPAPFIFSRNANLAIRLAWDHGGHILLVNDDVRLEAPLVTGLEAVLQDNPQVGIAAPMVYGLSADGREVPATGNALQIRQAGQRRDTVVLSEERIPFICVMLRREMVAQVGQLDEGFTGYGGDDTDYCRRAQQKGWKLAITRALCVRHGLPGQLPFSSSFLRVMSPAQRAASMARMDERERAKSKSARP